MHLERREGRWVGLSVFVFPPGLPKAGCYVPVVGSIRRDQMEVTLLKVSNTESFWQLDSIDVKHPSKNREIGILKKKL